MRRCYSPSLKGAAAIDRPLLPLPRRSGPPAGPTACVTNRMPFSPSLPRSLGGGGGGGARFPLVRKKAVNQLQSSTDNRDDRRAPLCLCRVRRIARRRRSIGRRVSSSSSFKQSVRRRGLFQGQFGGHKTQRANIICLPLLSIQITSSSTQSLHSFFRIYCRTPGSLRSEHTCGFITAREFFLGKNDLAVTQQSAPNF